MLSDTFLKSLLDFGNLIPGEVIRHQRVEIKSRNMWWSPTAGSFSKGHKFDWFWINGLGLPLHLWSSSIMKKIGERCGKWIEMEEETELKNHLRWAQIPQGETDSSRYPEMQDRETPHNLFRFYIHYELSHTSSPTKANSSVLSTAP
ncbi:hypothetical protein H5410_027046 [Solanum commersonii]|uniref:DUF4283 domain-containing protein n=1 Tax=Solanum commersonii TaxID=4109 RepID=A0A9J5YYR6_SOLCO|nr:hypothetical protein H5410_027046 [Solanum commersonii]